MSRIITSHPWQASGKNLRYKIISLCPLTIFRFLQASNFLLTSVFPKGCCCGECVAFNIPKALRFLGHGQSFGSRLRAWLKQSNNGCTNRKMNIKVDGNMRTLLSCKGHYFPMCLGKWLKKGWVTLISYFYIVVLVFVVNRNLILGRNLSWPEGMQHPNANACVQFMDNISIICVI